ncbi:MAG: FadR family transcriptional regulator [Lachnospiraceae bacterium]|nr:FadR family transcriptional regulator [Lachnospiraceae bacterium]
MKKSASDCVLDYIYDKIISGQWTPGTKIATETELQAETGVSKTSVRSAVEKLVAMEILTKRQGDGTYVADVSVSSMFNPLLSSLLTSYYDPVTVLAFREIIEPACVELFVEYCDDEQIAQLEECLREMDANQYDADTDLFYKADNRFHLIIGLGTNNAILSKIMNILDTVMEKYHKYANKSIGAKTGVAEHAGILEAIKSRDKELASLLMKRHIQRSMRDINEAIAADAALTASKNETE